MEQDENKTIHNDNAIDTNGQQQTVKPLPANSESSSICVRVKSQDGNEMHFRIKPTTPFSKVAHHYCSRTTTDPHAVRFLFDGRRISISQTADEIGLIDGSEIDAMVTQIGGGAQLCCS